jgi:hypothetical protein
MERESNQLHVDVTGQRPIGMRTYAVKFRVKSCSRANNANNWWEHNPTAHLKSITPSKVIKNGDSFENLLGKIWKAVQKERNGLTRRRSRRVSNYFDVKILYSDIHGDLHNEFLKYGDFFCPHIYGKRKTSNSLQLTRRLIALAYSGARYNPTRFTS